MNPATCFTGCTHQTPNEDHDRTRKFRDLLTTCSPAHLPQTSTNSIKLQSASAQPKKVLQQHPPLRLDPFAATQKHPCLPPYSAIYCDRVVQAVRSGGSTANGSDSAPDVSWPERWWRDGFGGEARSCRGDGAGLAASGTAKRARRIWEALLDTTSPIPYHPCLPNMDWQSGIHGLAGPAPRWSLPPHHPPRSPPLWPRRRGSKKWPRSLDVLFQLAASSVLASSEARST